MYVNLNIICYFNLFKQVLAVKESIGGGKTLLRVFNLKLISNVSNNKCFYIFKCRVKPFLS